MQCIIPTTTTVTRVSALTAMKGIDYFCGINHLLPPKQVNTDVVTLRQEDSVRGMLSFRNQSGLIPVSDSVFNIYGRDCTFKSGSWGETKTYEAANLRRLADPGADCFDKPLDTTNYFNGEMSRMLYRALVRLEATIWQVLLTGVFNTYDAANNLVHTQFYPIRRLIASPFITNVTDSRPLAIFSNIAAYFRDTDVSFAGKNVEYWINSFTLQKIFDNLNPTDLGKFNTGNGCSPFVLNLDLINSIFASRNLGTFKICDAKRLNNAGVATQFVKDGFVLIKGTLATGNSESYFAMVNPNLYHLGAISNYGDSKLTSKLKGLWSRLINNTEHSMNPSVQIGVGFDGMPVISRPDQYISLQLF